MKAAADRPYHGGSFRDGYGHGLAADVVSVNGETRTQRSISTENLWKWIDAHEKEFGLLTASGVLKHASYRPP
jgi:hypothetical protein